MENRINVSVIIPVYNAEKYLVEFMDSLLAQTLEHIQIICIDDCSTDNSYEILLNYKNRADMEVLKNDCNIGAANTRNRGLELTKGEYVICFDCDDVLQEDYLSNLYNACKANDADVAVGYIIKFFDNNIANKRKLGFKCLNRNRIKSYPVLDDPGEQSDLFQIITHGAHDKLVRREVINKYNICFQDLPCTNDLSYAYTCVLSAKKIIFVDSAFFYYRSGNPGSISGKWRGRQNFLLEAMDKVYDYLIATGMIENLFRSFIFKVIKDTSIYYYAAAEAIKRETIQKFVQYYRKWETDKFYEMNTISEFEKKLIQNIAERNLAHNYYDILFDISGTDIIEFIKPYQEDEEKKVALWGVGAGGQRFVKNLMKQLDCRMWIIDNDIEKQGKTIENFRICSYEQVKNKISLILTTSYAVYEYVEEHIGSKIPMINVFEFMEEKALKKY